MTADATKRPLPPELSALLHQIELAERGWEEKATQAYILFSLAQLGTVSTDELREYLREDLGYPVSGKMLKSSIEEMLGTGVVLPAGKDTLILSEGHNQILDRNRADAEMEQEAIAVHWQETQDEFGFSPRIEWPEIRDSFLIPCCMELGARTYELLRGADEDGWQALERARRAFAQRIEEDARPAFAKAITSLLSVPSPALRSFLLRLLHGQLILLATNLPHRDLAAITNRQGKPKLDILLDTNLLFSLLDLHENPADDPSLELYELAIQLKGQVEITLAVSSATLEEARNTLTQKSEQLDALMLTRRLAGVASHNLDDLSGIAQRFVRASAESKAYLSARSFFAPYIDSMEEFCDAKGIQVVQVPADRIHLRPEVIDAIEAQREREELRAQQGKRAKGYHQISHDVILWFYNQGRRSSRLASPANARFWVGTVDFRFLRLDSRLTRQRGLRVQNCIHPSSLISLLQFWVPRTEELESAMLSSLIPLLPQYFDREAERATLRILEVLGRYEVADPIAEDTARRVLVSRALRNRIRESVSVAEEDDAVETALHTELSRELETVRTQHTRTEQEQERMRSSLRELQVQQKASRTRLSELEQTAMNERARAEALEKTLTKLRPIISLALGLAVLSAGIGAGYFSWHILGEVLPRVSPDGPQHAARAVAAFVSSLLAAKLVLWLGRFIPSSALSTPVTRYIGKLHGWLAASSVALLLLLVAWVLGVF